MAIYVGKPVKVRLPETLDRQISKLHELYSSDEEIDRTHVKHVLTTLEQLRRALRAGISYAVADFEKLHRDGMSSFPISHVFGPSAAELILRESQDD